MNVELRPLRKLVSFRLIYALKNLGFAWWVVSVCGLEY